MHAKHLRGFVLVAAGFAAGLVVNQLPTAIAGNTAASDPSQIEFSVSIDEVKQNFVFAEHFSGQYRTAVTLSDGSTRQISLTPMLREGRQVVELNDNGGVTYMGLNGTTTNGSLMIQLRDIESLRALNAIAAN